jgi:prepilin-type processing-associated H-X9-DG protein
LIELLVAIAIIAIFAALILPTGHPGSHNRVRQVACAAHLRSIHDNFAGWARQHERKYPMQVAEKDGGSRDWIPSGSVAVHFLALTNSGLTWNRQYTAPGTNRVSIVTHHGLDLVRLLCPGDRERRRTSLHLYYGTNIADADISYFLNLDAEDARPIRALAGDRNLEFEGKPVPPSLFNFSQFAVPGWTGTNHSTKKGNVLFTDGHVEFLRSLGKAVNGQSHTNRLAIP